MGSVQSLATGRIAIGNRRAGIAISVDTAGNTGVAMRNLNWLLLLTYAAIAVGCNTFEGLGKDVSKVGDKIEHKADEKRR
jgi:predicted small secreted protein